MIKKSSIVEIQNLVNAKSRPVTLSRTLNNININLQAPMPQNGQTHSNNFVKLAPKGLIRVCFQQKSMIKFFKVKKRFFKVKLLKQLSALLNFYQNTINQLVLLIPSCDKARFRVLRPES